jgi:hypothetical protein
LVVVSTEARSELLGQLVRFAFTGGLMTALVAAGYWAIATFAGIDPMVSLTIVFCLATGSATSCTAAGAFGDTRRAAAPRRAPRVSSPSTSWVPDQPGVRLAVGQADGGPTWWPVLPIMFVTPLLTFALNRQWVFR